MIPGIDLDGAAEIYAVSNTPLFLLRKIHAEPVTRQVAQKFSADEILAMLETSLAEKPRTLLDTVEPYVLLIALTQKREIALLKRAASFQSLHHDWFSYLSKVLIETFSSTTISNIYVPGQLIAPRISATSSAANSRQTDQLDDDHSHRRFTG